MSSEQLRVGQSVTARRVFSQADFDRFAALSGDDNPIHVDSEFSAQTKFGQTVCHGMLLYSTICQVLGDKLPGPGTVQLEQSLMFPTPTYAGEEMHVHLELLAVRSADATAVLATTISHADGRTACQGECRVGRNIGLLGTGQLADEEEYPSNEMSHKGLQIGQSASTRRVFTPEDLEEYADLTGDRNPLFSDATYAQLAGLRGPMIPGGLLGGLFSYLLGTALPGQGTNWLKQRLVFVAPAYPGEEITAQVEIKRLRPDKELVNLWTRCLNPEGHLVCAGEALVLVSDLIGK